MVKRYVCGLTETAAKCVAVSWCMISAMPATLQTLVCAMECQHGWFVSELRMVSPSE
jgi:hypothetical protein